MDNMNLIESKLILESRVRSSAHWFYWIAGLSLINTIVIFAGGSFSFVFGLGITQIIDGFAYYLSEEFGNIATYIAVAIDVFIACMFILIGKFAVKRKKRAFIVGMVLFGLDGLIFLIWTDYLSIAFHVWAVYSIYTGIPAIRHLEEVEKQLQELKDSEAAKNAIAIESQDIEESESEEDEEQQDQNI